MPDGLGLALSSFEFGLLLKWILGSRLSFDSSFACAWCGIQTYCFGDHAVSCSHSNMALRHSAVVRGLERLLGQAGVFFQREQTVCRTSMSNS